MNFIVVMSTVQVVGGGIYIFFFQAEDGIRDYKVTGVQTCALPIWFQWSPIKKCVVPMFPCLGTEGSKGSLFNNGGFQDRKSVV